jgi:hypothetical protein
MHFSSASGLHITAKPNKGIPEDPSREIGLKRRSGLELGEYWRSRPAPALHQSKGLGRSIVAQKPEFNMPNEENVQTAELREPFACPHCGQMLAPTCRVCVACGEHIEPAEILRIEGRFNGQPSSESQRPTGQRAQFSWPFFFAILAGAMVIISIAIRLLGVETAKLAFVGFTLMCAGWVFYDARSKGIPQAWRWTIMTVFFWIVFFPWYLSRRRTPSVPCLVMEKQTSVFFRALFWCVVILLFLSFIAAVIKSPPR